MSQQVGTLLTASCLRAFALLGLTVCVQLSSAAPRKATPDTSLLAWYTMDGHAADSSGNELHGRLVGPLPAEDRFGKSGRALAFDGADDWLALPASRTMDFGYGDFTISVWLRTPGPTGASDLQSVLLLRRHGSMPCIGLYTARQARSGLVGARVVTDRDVRSRIKLCYAAARDDAWHHVALVLRNGVRRGLKLYLDGVCIATATADGDLSGWQLFRVGGVHTRVPEFFEGAMDELRVYGRALTEDEVKAEAENTTAPSQVSP